MLVITMPVLYKSAKQIILQSSSKPLHVVQTCQQAG